jgi:hypothetical protein
LLKKVSESDGWHKNYLDKFKLVGEFKAFEEATVFMKKYQEDYLATKVKK